MSPEQQEQNDDEAVIRRYITIAKRLGLPEPESVVDVKEKLLKMKESLEAELENPASIANKGALKALRASIADRLGMKKK